MILWYGKTYIIFIYILHMFNMLCFALAEVLVVLCSALRFGQRPL